MTATAPAALCVHAWRPRPCRRVLGPIPSTKRGAGEGEGQRGGTELEGASRARTPLSARPEHLEPPHRRTPGGALWSDARSAALGGGGGEGGGEDRCSGQGSGEWPWGQPGSVTSNIFLISTDLCPLLGALGILTYLPRGHGSVDKLCSPAAHSGVGEVGGCPVAETRRFWGAGARLVFPDTPSTRSGLP